MEEGYGHRSAERRQSWGLRLTQTGSKRLDELMYAWVRREPQAEGY